MEITRDALLRIVKITRATIRLADDMNNLLIVKTHTTYADKISGELCDVLFALCGEKLTYKQDFLRDSDTMVLIKSNMSDEDVTDEFIEIYKKNHPEQPAPETFEQSEMSDLYRRNGGYQMPEGDLE